MHRGRKRRLHYLLIATLGLSIALACILYALKQNINLYLTPSEVLPGHEQLNAMRLGGMVKKHSVQYGDDLQVRFVVTDFKHDMTVNYRGVLPALFKEGQGVVIEGHITPEHEFSATRVLAKHDEKYMPPKMEAKS